MGKETGIGNALYVSGRDLSGETQTWNLSQTKGMQNATTLRQRAFDRLGLLADSAFSYETLFDPDADHAHEYLSTLPTTDELAMLCHRETLGSVFWSAFQKQINYDGTRGADASLLFKVDAQGSKGTFWDSGYLLTAGMRTDEAATNGASLDGGAAKNFGLQAYLQVFEHTGDPATVKLQSSSDNGGADAWADVTGGAFAAVSSEGYGERIYTARDQTIERYLRVITTGTFTSITFAVGVVVNDTEVRV